MKWITRVPVKDSSSTLSELRLRLMTLFPEGIPSVFLGDRKAWVSAVELPDCFIWSGTSFVGLVSGSFVFALWVAGSVLVFLSQWFSKVHIIKPSREIFNWVSKVIRDCIGSALLCSVIGPENSRHSLNQSDAKLTSNMTWSPAFSRALDGLLIITLSSRGIFRVFSLLLISHCDFLSCFYETQ